MVASDLVTAALRLIGAVASGETPSTSEAADGLDSLKELLDSWSGEELLVFGTTIQSVTLAASTASYTLSTRPVKILSADLTVGGMNFGLEVVGPEAWANRDDKTDVSLHTKVVFCDYAYSSATLYVAPVPAGAATVKLYQTTDLATLAAGTTTFAMPEAYARAVRYNLAVDLAPEYGRAVDGAVLKIAQDTKNALMKAHASDAVGKSELELPSGGE